MSLKRFDQHYPLLGFLALTQCGIDFILLHYGFYSNEIQSIEVSTVWTMVLIVFNVLVFACVGWNLRKHSTRTLDWLILTVAYIIMFIAVSLSFYVIERRRPTGIQGNVAGLIMVAFGAPIALAIWKKWIKTN
ncbi:MAG: hypothetical protein KIS92_18285 [Planctomycetota bacterium]|nr:hypothetical protein [Planctomycetota bacterium]